MTASHRTGRLDLSANAITVLERRYLVKDDQGAPVEQPEDLFWRVARTVAAPDLRYGASERAVEGLAETFFELMATRAWMPNSPTLMNAGRPLGQLSACFVLPVDDCLSNGHSGIYDTLRAMAAAPQRRGALDHGRRLRPRVVHEAVRRVDRCREAGRHAPRRQHGHPARRSPRHPRVHPL